MRYTSAKMSGHYRCYHCCEQNFRKSLSWRVWARMIQIHLSREKPLELFERHSHPLRKLSISNLIVGMIVLSIFLQLYLVFTRQINWDEFYFLSHIYEYQRGELSSPTQTFYVHFFQWLTGLPANEIGQIIIARLIMLALHTGALGLIYYAARRFTSRDAALLGVLSYTACGYVLLHGAAFRADPIATFLLIAAVTALLAPRLSWLHTVFAGAAIAIAGLVTIKSIFYVPVIVAVAISRLVEEKDRHSRLLTLLIGGIASIAIFEFLYLAHSSGLTSKEHIDILTSASISAKKVFDGRVFLREWPFFETALATSPLTFAAIGFGIALCLRQVIVGNAPDRLRNLVLLAFVFPFATLCFYRNGFPYYYVFVLAPAALLSAIAFDRISWPITKLASVLVLAASTFFPFVKGLSPGQGIQRATLNAIHSIFPKPVAYIDGYSMVGSFPKVGVFMSAWGIENYRAAGRPALPKAIVDTTPGFVLADAPALEEALVPGSVDVPTAYKLFETDANNLRDNFVHHWGAIWVAGKTVELGAGHDQSVPILIAGTYTLEAQGPIAIDGITHAPSDVISLLRGTHIIRSVLGLQTITLRWGDHLWRPTGLAPQGPIFSGF
jgi:hypothetical protein